MTLLQVNAIQLGKAIQHHEYCLDQYTLDKQFDSIHLVMGVIVDATFRVNQTARYDQFEPEHDRRIRHCADGTQLHVGFCFASYR